jgi:hypothetical protein
MRGAGAAAAAGAESSSIAAPHQGTSLPVGVPLAVGPASHHDTGSVVSWTHPDAFASPASSVAHVGGMQQYPFASGSLTQHHSSVAAVVPPPVSATDAPPREESAWYMQHLPASTHTDTSAPSAPPMATAPPAWNTTGGTHQPPRTASSAMGAPTGYGAHGGLGEVDTRGAAAAMREPAAAVASTSPASAGALSLHRGPEVHMARGSTAAAVFPLAFDTVSRGTSSGR